MPTISTRLRTVLLAALLPLLCLLVGLLCGHANVLARTGTRPAAKAQAQPAAPDAWTSFTQYLDPADPRLLVWDVGWKQRCQVWHCQAFARAQGRLALEPLEQSRLDLMERRAIAHDISLLPVNSQVLYNPAAANLLTPQTAGSRAYWNQQLRTPAARSPFVTGAADPPTVVKQVFHTVQLDQSCPPECIVRVAVYDPSVAPDHIEGYQRDQWPSSIQVDLDLSRQCPARAQASFRVDKSIQTVDTDAHAPGIVPLRCFPFKLSRNGILVEGPQARQSDLVSGAWLYLLLGFHMMRADRPLWSWSTFWWSPHPQDPASGCRLPAPADNPRLAPWQFFCLDSIDTNDLTTRSLPHRNPYLEASMDHGLDTNCIFCHSRALYHPGQPGVAADFASGHVPQTIQQQSPFTLCPVPGDSPGPGRPPCPAQTVPTDFLWSIALEMSAPAPAARRH